MDKTLPRNEQIEKKIASIPLYKCLAQVTIHVKMTTRNYMVWLPYRPVFRELQPNSNEDRFMLDWLILTAYQFASG